MLNNETTKTHTSILLLRAIDTELKFNYKYISINTRKDCIGVPSIGA